MPEGLQLVLAVACVLIICSAYFLWDLLDRNLPIQIIDILNVCILVNRMERKAVLIPFNRKESFSYRNLYNGKHSWCGGCSVRNYFDVDLFGAISETKNRGIR